MSEKIYIPNDLDQFREMIDLYESGMSYSEIGVLYGISPQTVGYIFSKRGYKGRKFTVSKRFRAAMDEKRNLIDERLLVKLYVKDSLSILKISGIVGENYNVVRNNLIFYNIAIRPIDNYATSELTPELLTRLFIEEDLTAQQIADQLGFSVLTIRKRLHKFGIKKRKTKEIGTIAKEMEWFTLQDLCRKYKISLPVIRRIIRQGTFPNARKQTTNGSVYWLVPSTDLEKFQSQLEALAQGESPDPKEIIQNRYGYGAEVIAEIIEFERQNFARDEIAAIFRMDRDLLDDLLKSSASQDAPRMTQEIKKFPKDRLIDLHAEQKLPVEEILKRLNTNYLTFYLSLKFHGIPLNHKPEKAVQPDPLTERRKEMIKLYETDLSLSEVGEIFGISARNVWYNFRRVGYKTRKYTTSKRVKAAASKNTQLIEKDVLEKLYSDEELSFKKTAAILKKSMWVVRNNIIYHKIPIRSKAGKTVELTEVLLRLLFIEEKLSPQEIADRFGYSPKTVNKRLRNFGIKREINK